MNAGKNNLSIWMAHWVTKSSYKGTYYMWQVNTNGSVRFRPHRWSGGNPSLLSEAAITRVSIKNGEQHKLTVKVTGANTARTYIDDVLIDTRTGDFAYGDFGFREDYDNGSQPEQALFDDFKVTADGKVLLEENFDCGTHATSSSERSSVAPSRRRAVWIFDVPFAKSPIRSLFDIEMTPVPSSTEPFTLRAISVPSENGQ